MFTSWQQKSRDLTVWTFRSRTEAQPAKHHADAEALTAKANTQPTLTLVQHGGQARGLTISPDGGPGGPVATLTQNKRRPLPTSSVIHTARSDSGCVVPGNPPCFISPHSHTHSPLFLIGSNVKG